MDALPGGDLVEQGLRDLEAGLETEAASKLKRGHARDLGDVREMVARVLVDPAELRRLFEEVEPQLYHYPALDPASFRRKVEEFTGG